MDILICPIPTPGKQVPMKTGLAYPYWLYLPEEYGTIEQDWPMILFLHGGPMIGSMGSLTNGALTSFLNFSSNREKYPELFQCVVVSPYCYEEWWTNSLLYEVVTEVSSKIPH